MRAERMWRAAVERAAELRKVHPQHPAAVGEELAALRAMDRARRASEQILRFAGIDDSDKAGKPGAPTAQPIADVRAALLKRLESLIKAGQDASAAAPPKKPDDEDPVH